MKDSLACFIFFVVSILTVGQALAKEPQAYGKFDLKAVIDSLPESSDKPYAEVRLLDNGGLGVRVVRVYHPVPRHHHDFSSTYLSIQSGRALFSIEGGEPFEAGAGEMVFWERGIDHEVVRILSHPLVFLIIDTPTRREGDVQMSTK